MTDYAIVASATANTGAGEVFRVPIPFDVPLDSSASVGTSLVGVVTDSTGSYAYTIDSSTFKISKISIPALSVTATITLASAPSVIAIDPQSAYLYVSTAATINQVNLSTFALTANTYTDTYSLMGLVTDSTGATLYALDSAGTLLKITTSTMAFSASVSIGSSGAALAINPASSILYAGTTNALVPVAIPALTVGTSLSGPYSPSPILVDPSDTYVFSCDNGLSRTTISSGVMVTANTFATPAMGLATDPTGDTLYYADAYNGVVALGVVSFAIESADVQNAGPIAVAPNGNVYVVTHRGTNVSIAANYQTFTAVATTSVIGNPTAVAGVSGSTACIVGTGGVETVNVAAMAVLSSYALAGSPNVQSGATDPTFTYAYLCDYANAVVFKVNIGTMSLVGSGLAVGTQPIAIAIDSAGSYAYVVNKSGNSVTKIDLSTFTTVGSALAVGTTPMDIVIDSTNAYAYVANNASNNVSKIDLSTFTVVTTLATAGNPLSLAIDATNLYVTSTSANALYTVPLSTFTVASTITAGKYVVGAAIDASAANLYLVNQSINGLTRVGLASPSVTGANYALYGALVGIGITALSLSKLVMVI